MIGNNGYFLIGANGAFLLPGQSGKLFLRTNDNIPGNGSGSFGATIRITRQEVKFYVYAEPSQSATLDENKYIAQPQAALDNEGLKAIPTMCMTCHGGTYDSNSHLTTNSSFLPFDITNLICASGIECPGTADQESLRLLNELILKTGPNPTDTFRPVNQFLDALNFWTLCMMAS